MCDIFKDCKKAFDEKRNKNRSQTNELVEWYLVYKDKNVACCNENNMGSEVEATSRSKDKRKKTCFRWSPFMIDYISAYKSQIAFTGLDIEVDKPRMKAELRVMMVELYKIKLN